MMPQWAFLDNQQIHIILLKVVKSCTIRPKEPTEQIEDLVRDLSSSKDNAKKLKRKIACTRMMSV